MPFKILKKKHNYSPKIYIVTSSVDEKDYHNVIKITTIEDYIIKPLNNDTLIKIFNDNAL
ncbi:MAG TPA: response regulator [Flavobacteriaceae bacterium]|nr:response regulator [Flavobacteriaceae bacterium]